MPPKSNPRKNVRWNGASMSATSTAVVTTGLLFVYTVAIMNVLVRVPISLLFRLLNRLNLLLVTVTFPFNRESCIVHGHG